MALAADRKRRPFFQKVRERWESFKEKLNAVLCPIDSPFLGLQPAYASAPSPSLRYENAADDFNKPLVCRFDTGPLPPKSSVSDSILRWENVEIYYPNEITPEIKKSGKPYITIEQAQEEVAKLLREPRASHQYIVYEAAKLSDDPEVQRYTLHLLVGALAEDYLFAPGEKIEHIFKSGYQSFTDKAQKGQALVPLEELLPPDEKPIHGVFEGLMKMVAKIFRKLIKSPEKDELNRPYMAHFYDPTREWNTGLTLLGGDINFQSALERILMYWDIAAAEYEKGNKPRAFYALGHMLHLVGDLHVPAHVHNDAHGPTILLGKLDSFEQWCIRCDYPDIKRPKNNPNIRIWDSGPLIPLEPFKNWNKANAKKKLADYIDIIVSYTQLFRSVDRKGNREDQQFTGKLSDQECFDQGEELIPRAIQHSAHLLDTFIYVYEKNVYGKKES